MFLKKKIKTREEYTYLKLQLSKNVLKKKKWYLGFPGSLDGKESACNADLGSIPESGRSPGEGNGNPLQHSCLENPMDGGA